MNQELALELITEIITKFEEMVIETKNSIRDPYQIKELEDDLIRSEQLRTYIKENLK